MGKTNLNLRIHLSNQGPEDAYDVKTVIEFSHSLFVSTIKKVPSKNQDQNVSACDLFAELIY